MAGGARLEVNGASVANPGRGDVLAGVDKAARQAGGNVTVTRAGGAFLEAAPADEGGGRLLSLAAGEGGAAPRQFSTKRASRDEAKALLGDFFDGGGAWRKHGQWRAPSGSGAEQAPASAGAIEGRWAALLAVGGAVGGAAAFLLAFQTAPALIPALAAFALVALMAWKGAQEFRVRRWPHANGRITASGLQPRRRRFSREETRIDNIPALSYEFTVAGKPHVGSRIGLNTEFAGVDVGALVARYPVGAVVAVYYNPARPDDCLLDPFANRGIAADLIKLFAPLGAIAAAIYYGGPLLANGVAARFPDANVGHAIFAGSAGLVFLLLLLWSFRARAPVAPPQRAAGVVTRAEVEEAVMPSNVSSYGGGGYLVAVIEIAYSVAGQNYVLRTHVSKPFAIGAADAAKTKLAPYPIGAGVSVTYDRDNPSAAAFEGNPNAISVDSTRTGYRVTALICALGCFAMALRALGVI